MADKQTNILLIEDNPADSRLIEEYLKEIKDFRFNILLADRLSTGLDYISKNDLDIILVDLGLPDSQGIETVDKVLKKETALPIIVLTGLDDIEKTKNALHKGIQDYLVKGQFDGHILVKSIVFSIERKESEKTIQIERDRFISILDSMADGVCIINYNNVIEYINPVLKKELGFAEKRKCYEYFNDFKKECPWCKNKEVYKGKIVRWEWYSKKNKKSYDLIDTPLKNTDGTISKITIFRDVTDIKKTEKELKESEDKYRSLYLSMNEGVCLHKIIYDKRKKPVDYIILDVNDAYERIIGLKRDHVIGKKATDAYRIGDAPYIDLYEKVARTGKSKLFEAYFTPLEKNFEISVFSYEKDKFVTVFSNITDRIKSEEEIKNSYKKLQKTLKSTIDTLASIVEIGDPYTAGHQKRVAALAVSISRELGLEKDTIEAVSTAAIIHDIGKINIPASILARPGKISSLEYDMIKTHPRLGYEMVKRIEFPWPIANIILQHHEKLDGSGYPEGLKGKDILFEAKIIAVADTVEAMSSHRPYRPALGIDKALEEITKNKGKLYDPEIVDICIRLFKNKGFKFN